MTAAEVGAVIAAVLREVNADATWARIRGLTLADLCADNLNALVDAWPPVTEAQRVQHWALIRSYDTLLGTSRAAELPDRR